MRFFACHIWGRMKLSFSHEIMISECVKFLCAWEFRNSQTRALLVAINHTDNKTCVSHSIAETAQITSWIVSGQSNGFLFIARKLCDKKRFCPGNNNTWNHIKHSSMRVSRDSTLISTKWSTSKQTTLNLSTHAANTLDSNYVRIQSPSDKVPCERWYSSWSRYWELDLECSLLLVGAFVINLKLCGVL